MGYCCASQISSSLWPNVPKPKSWRGYTRLVVEAPREDPPTVVPRFIGMPVEPAATDGLERIEFEDSDDASACNQPWLDSSVPRV